MSPQSKFVCLVYIIMLNTNYTQSNTTEIQPEAYYINEVAVRLRMSTKSVRRQIDRGNLRKCSKCGRILIPRKDVETFFERTSNCD